MIKKKDLFVRLQQEMDIFDAYERVYGIPADVRVFQNAHDMFHFINRYEGEVRITKDRSLLDSNGNLLGVYRPGFDDEVISILEPVNLFWCIRYSIVDAIDRIKSWMQMK